MTLTDVQREAHKLVLKRYYQRNKEKLQDNARIKSKIRYDLNKESMKTKIECIHCKQLKSTCYMPRHVLICKMIK
jgi:hypothetical protein